MRIKSRMAVTISDASGRRTKAGTTNPAWLVRRPNMAQRTQKRARSKADGDPRQVDNRVYEMQVRICKALANPNRLRILDLLGKQTYTVSGLQRELGIPLASVSLQLATLRAAGVVVTEKRGKQVYCSLALPEIRQACHFIRRALKAQVRNAKNLPI